MQERVKGSLKWILGLVLTFVGSALLAYAQSFLMNLVNFSFLANYQTLLGAAGLATLAIAVVLFSFQIRSRGKQSEARSLTHVNDQSSHARIQDSVKKGLINQTQLTDVTNSLRVHHKGIVDRMAQWSYAPSGSAEPIRLITHNIPNDLQNDKMHLKEYDEPWKLYSDGPKLYSIAQNLSRETEDLVKSKLSGPINSLPDSRQSDYLITFARLIIEKADTEYNHKTKTRDYHADMVKVNGVPTPAVNGEPLYNATIGDAQKLATAMNEIRSLDDVKDVAGKRREAWNAVLQNKAQFLTALRETVIDPARSSNYDDPRLTRGVCDNCKSLMQKRAMILEA